MSVPRHVFYSSRGSGFATLADAVMEVEVIVESQCAQV